MVKHASSHSIAVFVCTIASSVIVEILRPFLPHLLSSLEEFCNRFIYLFNIPLSANMLSIIVVASLLAAIWGVFFKLKNS